MELALNDRSSASKNLIFFMALLSLLVLSACRRTRTATTPSPTPQPEATTSPTPSISPPPSDCLKSEGGADGNVFLTGAQLSSEGGVDRFTLTFETGQLMPKWEVDEARPPFSYAPSDRPMLVEGKAYARLLIFGASGVEISGEEPRETYTGPTEFKPGLNVITEVEQEEDFEATMSWIFGTSRKVCWTVTEMAEPLRLVVEFAH